MTHSSPTPPVHRPLRLWNLGWVVLVAILVWFLARFGPGMMGHSASLHAPDMALIQTQPFAIQLHIATALTALAIGTALLVGLKGNGLHRTLGWIWVVAMATTAISSLFIRQINAGAFSYIHLLSGWTIVALPMAVYAARQHRVMAHRRAMVGLFVGGLLIAGLLTFLPGRLMWQVFMG
ncbi:DUF2306 domain-containing protein [Brevundimonas sp.]|uniref:DUF2306 domain-containing protein n=1 Tax=Brevundimonas sp. TaxID=1871086 RepID=UPI002AB9C974|nr:DUF2306 domain-containing protein [Brevundimonas sp.]MDZ4362633.1 DUF2306 domain-containing protein [Brevundimonas sp.]